jgi:hypothetical protein
LHAVYKNDGFQQHPLLIVLFTSFHAGLCAAAQKLEKPLGAFGEYLVLCLGCAELYICSIGYKFTGLLFGESDLQC